MLPELITYQNWYCTTGCRITTPDEYCIAWNIDRFKVLDTELLHLCWLVEAELRKQAFGPNHNNLWEDYIELLYVDNNYPTHATWQQRVTLLAKTLNITIE